MKRIYRTVQFAANIAILILTPLVAMFVLREFVYDSQPRQDTANLTSQNAPKPPATKPLAPDPLGKVVPIEGVNWKDNQKTLVLYLSTTCKYCNDSIPFYQRLLNEELKGSVKTVALFSESESEAAEYLKLHKVKVDEILSDSLRPIGVTGTPTLLLVNENGVVSDYWRGRLDKDKEAEVLAKLIG